VGSSNNWNVSDLLEIGQKLATKWWLEHKYEVTKDVQ
jgi:hypothetical protein